MRGTWLIWGIVGLIACTKTTESDTDPVTDTDVVDTDVEDTDVAEVCPDDLCILSGEILEDRTLHAYNKYLLRGGVFVGKDGVTPVTLTVEPGTTVYGETSTGGFLNVTRGSKLVAEGTKELPIVFTSSQAPGDRARQDWGGIILNGKAPINRCPEGGGACEAEGEGGTGLYGGTDAADSSGSLKYVVAEFCGFPITAENELNCVAFQGVGSGTKVDYLQAHMGGDDGVEFFGGTVNVKHLLITGALDDSMDWTDGWVGKAQHVVVQQYEDTSDNGVEADNQQQDNAATPRSNPTVDHITVIGSPDSEASDIGMLLREGTDGKITNAIITGFNQGCLDIDGTSTFERAAGGTLSLTRTIVSCATNFIEKAEDPTSLSAWFLAGTGNQAADPKLKKPYDSAAPDFALGTGSPALTGGESPADSFFDKATYIGGVDPANDWTKGWTHTARE